MQKYTITKIYKTNKDKQGNQLMANGRPYTRMSVKVAEYGDKWVSGFENKQNRDWKEGQVVEMIIEQNGEYLNFSLPKDAGTSQLNDKLELVLTKLAKIELMVSLLGDKKKSDEINVPTPAGVHYPTMAEEGIDPNDFPF